MLTAASASATASSLADEIIHDGPALDLSALAEQLAQQRVLIVTATRDSDDDKAVDLLARLRRVGAAHLTTAVLDSDHAFNSHRIALGPRSFAGWRLCGMPTSHLATVGDLGARLRAGISSGVH
jgi:hypothetical protein